MVKKTDDERLRELEEKMEQIKAKKQQVESRIREKERRERTRRLIQVGAIFEKYFEVEGKEKAEKIAFGMKSFVEKHKEKLLKIDVEKSKEANEIVYEETEETITIPEEQQAPYQVTEK